LKKVERIGGKLFKASPGNSYGGYLKMEREGEETSKEDSGNPEGIAWGRIFWGEINPAKGIFSEKKT